MIHVQELSTCIIEHTFLLRYFTSQLIAVNKAFCPLLSVHLPLSAA